MKMKHYHRMATTIQKTWRGFYTRKYVSNYYSRKRYLEGLKIKNEIMLNELEEYAEQQEQMTEIKKDIDQKKKLDTFSRKNHYLLSTVVQPGVFNSPYKPYPDEMEFHLRNAKMDSPSPHPPKKSKDKIFDPSWRRYDLPKPEVLPPVNGKPQGPFRDPREVQQQRYKPFQPTLRVESNYYSLDEAREKMKQEEWVNRLIDIKFQPSKRKTYAYEPLLHSTSSFGHLPYGTSYFRHEYPDKWLFGSSEKFRTVVPPIPVFEKLNDTYTEG
ncbi:hypothetical protein CAPTEDRAFT_159316 [Capitella teleta]|uniref:Spermatogenesis-associated protein 17 n=1 Tax=Capitella teleta TaxID=283909 RepID=R7URM2_CAPTE|nr:hypothetical protein CAPTEDRAFT_159316 [Capitella teleta]|eukprot:ELU08860.1 hypothetical protein CAPTEDRAFT_159316 [Capitella teleta]